MLCLQENKTLEKKQNLPNTLYFLGFPGAPKHCTIGWKSVQLG